MQSNISKIGEDILIQISGGKEHIGSCVMAIPYEKDGKVHATLSTLNRVGHKDDLVASEYAKKICVATNRCVVCVCGIHFDDFSSIKMNEVFLWVQQDIQNIIQQFNNKIGA